jgi:triosephosphate isomerase
MKRNTVVANWKMNPESLSEAKKLFLATKKGALRFSNTKTVICPPAPFLSALSSKSKNVFLGAQDVFWQTAGAHTGEVSPLMLKSLGVKYCIVGHSERRFLGETDERVSQKIQALLAQSIIPIVCVGEKERDIHGNYLGILENQIKQSLNGLQKNDVSKIIIAYEPIWAIGKSARDAMNPHRLHEMVIFIEKILANLYGRDVARKVTIIYGGSVEPKNVDDLVRDGNVSGFLVGHASLDAKGFVEILKAVSAR